MIIVPDRDCWRNWYLNDDVSHVLHNGDVLWINKGFRFDAHSVPFIFRLLFRRYNKDDIFAALVHDYLIATMPWHRYGRRFIDKEYKILMDKHSSGMRKFWMPKVVYLMGFLKTRFYLKDYRGDLKDKTLIEVRVTKL